MGSLHEQQYTFLLHLAQFFLEREMLQGKLKHPFYVQNLFFPPKSCCFMDMEMYCTAREATDNTMMCTTCWIPNVTNTHSVYVMLFAFQLQ